MIWIFRNGRMVRKDDWVKAQSFAPSNRSSYPSPRVSRFEEMTSPVTEKTISSWRERDRDMQAADAVDPRDIPVVTLDKRKAIVKRNAAAEPARHIEDVT